MPPSARADLSSSFALREVALFCGAGVSIDPPATQPDWLTLRDETLAAVGARDPAADLHVGTLRQLEMLADSSRRGLPPELIASAISAVTPAYFASLSALDHESPNVNHRIIARAARHGHVSCIITTNWDRLIEVALTREGVAFRAYRSSEEFASFDPAMFDPASIHLFKIHGCLSQPESIIARVEDEAVGLTGPKADVIRFLLERYVLAFWGYSGADLKIDLNYLRMVTSAPAARGFWWNLYQSGSYAEQPNAYVSQLLTLYGDRAGVCHNALPGALNALLTPEDRLSVERFAPDEIAALKATRSSALREALQAWAAMSIDCNDAVAIIADLLDKGGELPKAAECHAVLHERARADADWAGVGQAQVQLARIYSDIGETAVAEEHYRRTDDIARTNGDLATVLQQALGLGRLLLRSGHDFAALRCYGFAEQLLGWEHETAAGVERQVQMEFADALVRLKQVGPAQQRYEAAEVDARRSGAKLALADILARRAEAHQAIGDYAAAVRCLTEAEGIATSLNLPLAGAWFRLQWAELAAARTAALNDAPARLNEERRPTPESLERVPVLSEDDIECVVTYAQRTSNRRLAARAQLIGVGELLTNQSAPDVDDTLDRVDGYARDNGDMQLLATSTKTRARLLRQRGDTAGETALLERALADLDRSGMETTIAQLAERLADLHLAGHLKHAALPLYERAVDIWRKLGQFHPDLEDFVAITREQCGRGQLPESWEAFCSQAITRFATLERQFASSVNELGLADRAALGNALKADFGEYGRYTVTLLKIAERCALARRAGDPRPVLPDLEATIALAAELGDVPLETTLTMEHGLAHLTLGDGQNALARFERATALATQVGSRAELVDANFNKALVLAAAGQVDAALELYRQALDLASARHDLDSALSTSIACGELLKAARRDQEALSHFETAEILARGLSDPTRVEQIALRLAKLHWNLGSFESSIRYRDQVWRTHEANGNASTAGDFCLLAANTYDSALGRTADAIPHYRHAIELYQRGGREDGIAKATALLQQCQARRQAAPPSSPGLYECLATISATADASDRLSARMALGIDYDLWRFEPRSFCAWYERRFATQVPYPIDGDAAGWLKRAFSDAPLQPAPGLATVPAWSIVAAYQLLSFGRIARAQRRAVDAAWLCEAALLMSLEFNILQLAYLSAGELAAAHAMSGSEDEAARYRGIASGIHRQFHEWMTTVQAPTMDVPNRGRTLTLWSYLGLALRRIGSPDDLARANVVWGRVQDELFMFQDEETKQPSD